MWIIFAELVTIVSSYGRGGKNYFHFMSWQPDVFHLCFFLAPMQHFATVGSSWQPSHTRLARAYARDTGMRTASLPAYRVTASSWQGATRENTTAFVVELAAGALTPAQARRHARAVLRAGS